jgi:hypothetical protein
MVPESYSIKIISMHMLCLFSFVFLNSWCLVLWMVDQEVGMKETNDNDIDRHELCRRQKAISISLRGEVPSYLPSIRGKGVGTIRAPLNFYISHGGGFNERHTQRRA